MLDRQCHIRTHQGCPLHFFEADRIWGYVRDDQLTFVIYDEQVRCYTSAHGVPGASVVIHQDLQCE
jgi:hypothetical protein